ncbi:zinc/cadmium/mercury/lead-transporting ATPase [Arsenophonus sp.]|uniref:zinc/cadmium/mercury/lead-transporting ATPase n=1 Tax=Arsenophonus sp. TaxID=1872640 RepID=UPI00285A5408|nr:zinc/cadmium/mercury/lead-transporting ATPase [Arsenophonus sp.]MDR5616518.1 zinc/cadmium/mercury/lead-transporting ATPase [Arsenophonus sp.]
MCAHTHQQHKHTAKCCTTNSHSSDKKKVSGHKHSKKTVSLSAKNSADDEHHPAKSNTKLIDQQSCSDTNQYNCVSEHSLTPEESNAVISRGKHRFHWIVSGMDCASCARKIEIAVSKVKHVKQVKVLFTTEKLIVDADDDVRDDVIKAVQQAGFKLYNLNTAESATKKKQNNPFSESKPIIILIFFMLISWGISFIDVKVGQIAFILTTLYGLYPITVRAIQLIRSGTFFAIETLMSVAAIGALFINASEEAAMVLLLFMIGERLESYAAGRARRGISSLMALIPEQAVLIKNGVKTTVPVSTLQPGDIIEILPGGRLPTDAELVNEFASFDESALTGESMPVERKTGEKVSADALSIDRAIQMKVISEQGQNAIDRIMILIEEAEERRAPIERFIDRFSQIYTPLIMLVATLVIIIPPLFFAQSWDIWIYRGLTLLLIGCPCALVISTPAAITSALAAATRRGALIKGGAALEQLSSVTQVALDKTGTLTEGKPQVTDIITAETVTEETLLQFTASVESGSHHPLAKAILAKAQALEINVEPAQNHKALAGIGVEGYLADKYILVSAPNKISDDILTIQWQQTVKTLENQGKTVVVVLVDNKLLGIIAMQDTLRSDAIDAVNKLQKLGIKTVMLTGDNPLAAESIAQKVGLDYRAGLLPEDKVNAIIALSKTNHTLMVGDGINDAPAMKAANVGIAMGNGTDVALETADAALTHNRLTGLAEIIMLSRATRANIRQNITIALGLKAIFLVTSLLGITGLWMAILADSGATALVTANALRLLKDRQPE